MAFPAGLTFILGEVIGSEKMNSNGAGKSSLLYAIRVALYGEEPNGGSKDDLCNDNTDGWSVEMHMGEHEDVSPGQQLVVRRSKKRRQPEQLEWWYRGEHCHGSLEVVQTKLIGIIRLSARLFDNTVFVSRRARSFVDAKPAERATILEEMVADIRLEVAEKRAKAALDVVSAELQKIRFSAEALVSEDNRLQAEVIRLEGHLMAGMAQVQGAQQARARRIEQIRQEAVALWHQLAETANLEPATEALHTLHSRLLTLTQTIAGREAMRGDAGLLVGRQACPTCHRPLTEEILAARQRTGQALETELRAMYAQQEELSANLTATQLELGALQRRAGAGIQARQQYEQKERELAAAESETVPDMTPVLRDSIAEHNTRRRQIAQEKHALDARHLALGVEQEQLKEWQLGFSRQGLRNLMLDEIRLQMAWYAQHHMQILAGDALHLDFPQQTKSGREKFDILVKSGAGWERPLHMQSDGQLWRASLACMLGLGDALMHGTNSPLKFRMLDDPEGELDDLGRAEFIQALGEMSRHFPVICTLPREPSLGAVQAKIVKVLMRGEVSEIVKR